MEGENNRDLIQVVGGVPQFCKNVPSELKSLVGKPMEQITLDQLVVFDQKTRKPIQNSIGRKFSDQDRMVLLDATDQEEARLFYLGEGEVSAACVVLGEEVTVLVVTSFEELIQRGLQAEKLQEKIGADVYAVAMGAADDNENERRVWSR